MFAQFTTFTWEHEAQTETTGEIKNSNIYGKLTKRKYNASRTCDLFFFMHCFWVR